VPDSTPDLPQSDPGRARGEIAGRGLPALRACDPGVTVSSSSRAGIIEAWMVTACRSRWVLAVGAGRPGIPGAQFIFMIAAACRGLCRLLGLGVLPYACRCPRA